MKKMKNVSRCIGVFLLVLMLATGLFSFAQAEDVIAIPGLCEFSAGRFVLIEETDLNGIIRRVYEAPFDSENRGMLEDIMLEYQQWFEDKGQLATGGKHHADFGRFGEYTQDAVWFFVYDDVPFYAFSMDLSDTKVEYCHILIAFKEYEDKFGVDLYYSTGIQLSENMAELVAIPDSFADSSGRVLISEAPDASSFSYTFSADTAFMQDLVSYCGGQLSYDGMGSSNNYNVRNYEGSESDLQLVKDYVNALVSTHPYLKLQDSYWQSYDSDSFFSYAIDYTGNVNLGAQTEQTYTDNMCDVMIYGTIERSCMELSVWTPDKMELVDLGMRYGGGQADVSVGGQSTLAGLYRNADGTYETSDGRFCVSLGEAMIYRDGQVYTTEATYAQDDDRDCIWMRYFYRDETLHFSYPSRRLMTGDLFRLKDFEKENSWLISDCGILEKENDLTGYRWEGIFLGANHNGEWMTPINAPTSPFEDATVRVMYMDEEIAVFYIYAEYDTAPYAMEALCAVPLKYTVTENDVDYLTYTGQLLDVSFDNTYFGASYELFEWEIISGGDLASLSNTQSKTCTLMANKSGYVTLRVTYSYGAKEPDVLTGNMTNASHTITQDYTIMIK